MNKIYYVDITDISLIDISKIDSNFLQLKQDINDELKKKQSFIGYLLLKKVLEEKGMTSFDYTLEKNGKPYLANCNIHFNITHSNNIVALILSNEEVGIDCQILDKDRNFNNLSKYLFTDTEMKLYNNNIDFFYKTWVRKEAYFKMLGVGLSKDFNLVELDYPVNVVKDKLGNSYYISATINYVLVKVEL